MTIALKFAATGAIFFFISACAAGGTDEKMEKENPWLVYTEGLGILIGGIMLIVGALVTIWIS